MGEHDVKVIPADFNDHRKFYDSLQRNLFNLRENYLTKYGTEAISIKETYKRDCLVLPPLRDDFTQRIVLLKLIQDLSDING